MEHNRRNILACIRPMPSGRLLDLGCDDGQWTLQLGKRLGSHDLHGVDLVEERLHLARQSGIQTHRADLGGVLPHETECFDVVHANQVIEHVSNVDTFLAEAHRVLKPGWLVVMSTENASSWANVFAIAFGWQMFSLTNLSARASGIGNPLALHRGEVPKFSTWTHKVIFSYSGLREFFQLYDFRRVRLFGAGYFPLPSILGELDARHAHFLTVQAWKPR